ncbi:leucyl aminopeptidase [Rhizobium paknamense]|uniref:Probable cytosol aminopeptidase n=1 Tax=Rhizobium paknamense TaxID=1206817 RepID=A0ABU0I8X8_9HYPH|nr:leucyl aminopeptidase [Rhizobium paknamense]MDQ0454132.1 leucyl aminopeptidase [Rhizobium paknamense]
MPAKIEISFTDTAALSTGLALSLKEKQAGGIAAASLLDPGSVFEKAAATAKFTGKALSVLDLIAPAGSPAERLVILGAGKAEDLTAHDWLKLGGTASANLKGAGEATIFLDAEGLQPGGREAADFALGMLLRNYAFDTYKTKKKDEDDKPPVSVKVEIVTDAARDAHAIFESDSKGVAEGVILARDLVNLPPNVLGPVEFAEKAKALEALGVEVEILDEAAMKALGMGALLGVAQGSVRPPRLAVMQWKGAGDDRQPLAFIGKGVVFDSGGISIKPAGGMEDMKGDMGGAAAVIGLMHVLAARKAKVNAVGILGLVENMPDGNAQRPGDIVTSMSGQTIEIINTDAEGRLVLGDALWYCKERFKPAFMINLATLTGAIMVALGNLHAGLFSNDDALAENLLKAGAETQERLWRMPLGKDYDKLIDSKFADMKNTGGRYGGSITAAQFLQRFVGDTPWAHLDIAGTAMGSPNDEINASWASGFGVRLLDRLVRDAYEG